jgi:nucleotide-binding universal stress UspA family protein
MRMSRRPTLLMCPPVGMPAEPLAHLSRMMVPLDGSCLAEQALAYGAGLARALGAHLTLVRAEAWLNPEVLPAGYLPHIAHLDAEVTEAATAYLTEALHRLPPDIDAGTRILRGSPGEVLTAYAEQQSVNLVVMSTHGRSGLRPPTLGSTADRMVRCGVPTLLIHPTPVADIRLPEPCVAVHA